MKRVLLYCGVYCLLMLGGWAASAAPANFAGTWSLDKAKSTSLPRNMEGADKVTRVVTQNDKQVLVEDKISAGGQERNIQPLTYNLDGSEITVDNPPNVPGKITVKAKWLGEGKSLELHSVRTVKREDNEFTITTKEEWELADGGKTLKIKRSMESPQGKQESALVFTKN